MKNNKKKSRFILLYDCPLKICDKMWLYNGLKKYNDVVAVGTLINKPYFDVKRSCSLFKIGNVVVRLLKFIQNIRSIIISRKNDIIVVWDSSQGYLLHNICNKMKVKRKIVSFMWIDLPNKHLNIVREALKDSYFMPIINNKALEKEFMRVFGLEKWNGMFLPDVFDDKQKFEKIKYREDKYIFAGGVNNRDWSVLIDAVAATPLIKYVIVGDKGKIKNPNLKNLIIKENIAADEYYELMSGSFITICPLKEDRVSGLINILKSSQFGIPCISTRLGVTEMYYSTSGKNNLLYIRGDFEDLNRKIEKLYNVSKDTYVKIAEDFQRYIKDSFNPKKNVEKLINELKNREWM